MFRLLMLRNKLALQRNLVTRLTARSNVAAGLGYRSAHRSRIIDGVVVVDVDMDDIAKGDVEFARSFTKSISSLDHTLLKTAAGPVGKTDNQLEDPATADKPLPAGSPSGVLDKDGNPIVHIEIDGWNQGEDVEDTTEPEKQDATIEGKESVDKK